MIEQAANRFLHLAIGLRPGGLAQEELHLQRFETRKYSNRRRREYKVGRLWFGPRRNFKQPAICDELLRLSYLFIT